VIYLGVRENGQKQDNNDSNYFFNLKINKKPHSFLQA